MRIKGGGRGSTNAAGSGRTTARVRHHQGKPERDSREEQALRDGALPWLGVVIYSLGLPSWVLVFGAGQRALEERRTRRKPLQPFTATDSPRRGAEI